MSLTPIAFNPDAQFGDRYMQVPVTGKQRAAALKSAVEPIRKGAPAGPLLTMRLRVEFEAASLMGENVRDEADLAGRVAAWRSNASAEDLTAGLVASIILRTFQRCHGLQEQADELFQHLLLPAQMTVPALQHLRKQGDVTRGLAAVSRDLARVSLSDPRIASFVLSPTANSEDGSRIAAVTRPDGRIGLPGGKMDPGETIAETAFREAGEEGWDIAVWMPHILHVQEVEGHRCVWLLNPGHLHMKSDFEEKGRIEPIEASREDLVASGMGNDVAIPKLVALINEAESGAHAPAASL